MEYMGKMVLSIPEPSEIGSYMLDMREDMVF
jgi:hypothetical protein